MADKEERIFVFTTKKYTIKETNEDGVIVDGSIDKDKAQIYTRKEAIEKMAKAIFEWQRPGCRGDVPIEDVWNNEQEGYEKLAEVALNALLEGVKKWK